MRILVVGSRQFSGREKRNGKWEEEEEHASKVAKVNLKEAFFPVPGG